MTTQVSGSFGHWLTPEATAALAATLRWAAARNRGTTLHELAAEASAIMAERPSPRWWRPSADLPALDKAAARQLGEIKDAGHHGVPTALLEPGGVPTEAVRVWRCAFAIRKRIRTEHIAWFILPGPTGAMAWYTDGSG